MNKKTDLPPILPNIQNILKEYLICPERLPIHEYERNQEYWPREPDIRSLYGFDRVPCGTTLKVQRDPNTGKIIEFREVPVKQTTKHFAEVCDGFLSFPISRGDFSNPVAKINQTSVELGDVLSVAPGFDRGLQFAKDGCTVFTEPKVQTEEEPEQVEPVDEPDNTVNLLSLVKGDQDLLGLWSENKTDLTNVDANTAAAPTLEIDETEVLPAEPTIPVLKISEAKSKLQVSEWAVMVDVQQPVNDFRERIPEMAIEFDFELDAFQKQAIIKLEEHRDVFVAAHTSAGKTVVAEYAIALSQKHKTRTIYTSPIKALSNQKYRDFKNQFEDVGLITGDIQMNQNGVCLIMTTEILRSMLYRTSEIIADLEYVIFDEVHYINDVERGYVWEDVLMLLPDHVRIVLLSATVPNTMEFANWLGKTKQRKIYVISTLKRPVPLEHYLYTGINRKTNDQRFKFVDAKGNFLLKGYNDAEKAFATSREMCHFRPDLQTDSRALKGLIEHLQRKELLPAVAFTFSRAKCDKIADKLGDINLTTRDEKRRISAFFQQCVRQLKEPDQRLPQVLKMHKVLVQGIGVHHSGILPLIKEIVEILFSNGLVKVLFATETFAMGVNMPARTVVFNSIKKYDGEQHRYLKPGEYIQMAGRAGRRKHDTHGTVIIRCTESQVPHVAVFRELTQGRPQKLESKYRLTYSLILNALRVESWNWSVESMMSRSFYEVNHLAQASTRQAELQRIQSELSQELTTDLDEQMNQLAGYYTAASEYLQQWNDVQPKIVAQPRVTKEMTPGRVLVVNHMEHFRKLAILLALRKETLAYRVLVLCNQPRASEEIDLVVQDDASDKSEDLRHSVNWYRMLSFTHEEFFRPEGAVGHAVLDITAVDIIAITNKAIKINCEMVVNDWDKRQIPRFRDDPPGQTCQQAIQELAKLTNTVLDDSDVSLQYQTFPVKDLTLNDQVEDLNAKKKNLEAQMHCTRLVDFEGQFYPVFKRKYLEEKLEHLNYLMSSRSLTLYPEYLDRKNVLKQLKYINDQDIVLAKGNVARKMSMNELLITELVLRNTLTHLQPCEIAALLSSLVFQVKLSDDKQKFPKLSETLEQGMKAIADIHDELNNLELRNHIKSTSENLNFELVQFVNEWAKGKPFADIMPLTDIQEGIIVRCIIQLNETLKDVREAASKFGNSELPTKIDEAVTAIKRDIVFAASLYTQNTEVTVSPASADQDDGTAE